ncbi:MAG: hypothetical protein AAF806_10620 [Bacteroidota bacterium]
MKKLIFNCSMLLSLLLCTNFTYTSSEAHTIVKTMLELEAVQDMIERDFDTPNITIVTNGLIPSDFNLFYAGKSIAVVDKQQSTKPKNTDVILEIINFKLEGQAAQVKFRYGDYRSNIKLKKEGDVWIHQSIVIRGDGYFHWTVG